MTYRIPSETPADIFGERRQRPHAAEAHLSLTHLAALLGLPQDVAIVAAYPDAQHIGLTLRLVGPSLPELKRDAGGVDLYPRAYINMVEHKLGGEWFRQAVFEVEGESVQEVYARSLREAE